VTRFPELDELLDRLVAEVSEILGANLFGFYLTGSFAFDAGDEQSDCDFLVVLREQVSPEQEAALRRLHDEIPTRPGYWPKNIEGSYAPFADVRTLDALGRDWLYINHGWREMQWDEHCNRPEIRWILRERSPALVGPPPRRFAAVVPADVLRRSALQAIESFMSDLVTWASFDILWTQRYAVATLCRMLFTLDRGEVTSKPGALEWGLATLDERWHPLLRNAAEDRPRPWRNPPRPGSVEQTYAFADYVVALARERAL
jgi:predicted nucleotidyltransferase